MTENADLEVRRTNALAYWRYAHDYLRAVRTLSGHHRLDCDEAQANYHLAAQALEFALKAFLRARGVPADTLCNDYRHSLPRALREAIARGLPTPPREVTEALNAIAPHHQDTQFIYVPSDQGAFPDLAPLFAAANWLLEAIAPVVAADYTAHYSAEASPSTEAFIVRLRADLSATMSESSTLQ